MIFYDRSIFNHNRGLVEITDKEFLNKLKVDHNRKYGMYKSMTPIICGTVINNGLDQPIFERKLKMIRAPLFSLL